MNDLIIKNQLFLTVFVIVIFVSMLIYSMLTGNGTGISLSLVNLLGIASILFLQLVRLLSEWINQEDKHPFNQHKPNPETSQLIIHQDRKRKADRYWGYLMVTLHFLYLIIVIDFVHNSGPKDELLSRGDLGLILINQFLLTTMINGKIVQDFYLSHTSSGQKY